MDLMSSVWVVVIMSGCLGINASSGVYVGVYVEFGGLE